MALGNTIPENPQLRPIPKELVNHPSHYQFGEDNTYEVIKVLEMWNLTSDAYLWNVIKYVSRAGKKEKGTLLEDLRKARFYLDRRITLLEQK